PNDEPSQAVSIKLVDGQAVLNNLTIHDAADQDWFQVAISGPGGSTDQLRIDYDQANGPLALALFGPDDTLLAETVGANGLAQLFIGSLAPDTYYVRVRAASAASFSSNYKLSVALTVAPTALISTVASGVSQNASYFRSSPMPGQNVLSS